MKEYAFDVTMQAVIRVRADTEEHARKDLLDAWGDETWMDIEIDNTNLTAGCLDVELQEPSLFEVDGEEVDI